MNLIKFIKKYLFIQNITASIVAIIPPYLEFTVGKYMAIKKALYITAHDKTFGSYIEFGIFTGSSFNFAMKANKSLDKLLGKSDCNFIGFDHSRALAQSKKRIIIHDSKMILSR